MSEEEQINSVIEVTGTSKEEAQHLLAACDNNVEAAVAVYFEQGVDLTPAALAASLNNIADQQLGEEDVRPPIAPIRETLVGPDDDNFRAAPSTRLVRLPQLVKVCPLRDFAREGALMEEELHQAASAAGSNSVAMLPTPFEVAANITQPGQPRRRISRATEMVTAALNVTKSYNAASTSRLGDLFRPPTDIAYAGTFASARARATELKLWLLVNVQGDNFNSQLLNRDIWSDKAVRKVLRRQFLLWQVDSETTEGRRFVTFYHCAKLPYVCIIDPRTGEEMWKSTDTKQENFLTDMQKFLREHREIIDDDTPSTSKRSVVAIDDDDDVIECPLASTFALPSNNPVAKKRSKLLDLSEEEQVALAIRNSMRENGKNGMRSHHNGSDDDDDDDDDDNNNGSDTGSLKEFIEEERKQLKLANNELQESYESYLGEGKNELTMIKLRLLNAEGADEMVQLKWPSDTRLQTIRMYIDQKHEHLQKDNKGYKLICAFPRKPLEGEHDLCTLKELGLHPSANLHVTLED